MIFDVSALNQTLVLVCKAWLDFALSERGIQPVFLGTVLYTVKFYQTWRCFPVTSPSMYFLWWPPLRSKCCKSTDLRVSSSRMGPQKFTISLCRICIYHYISSKWWTPTLRQNQGGLLNHPIFRSLITLLTTKKITVCFLVFDSKSKHTMKCQAPQFWVANLVCSIFILPSELFGKRDLPNAGAPQRGHGKEVWDVDITGKTLHAASNSGVRRLAKKNPQNKRTVYENRELHKFCLTSSAHKTPVIIICIYNIYIYILWYIMYVYYTYTYIYCHYKIQ